VTTRARGNLDQLAAVCTLLEPLLDRFVLVGGCATGLLITDPGAADVRATVDVDLIVDVLSKSDYAKLEGEMRKLGFQPSMSDDVICRWQHGKYLVDVMPTDETVLGFSNPWYKPAIANAMAASISGRLSVRHVSAPYFVATKMVAFEGRGGGDYGASHDLDDLIAVIDGRQELRDEIQSCDVDLIKYIAGTVRKYCDDDDFQDTLAWHLPPDEAGQARLPILRERLDSIGNLAPGPR
jgi:hypothetical protein